MSEISESNRYCGECNEEMKIFAEDEYAITWKCPKCGHEVTST